MKKPVTCGCLWCDREQDAPAAFADRRRYHSAEILMNEAIILLLAGSACALLLIRYFASGRII